MSLALFATGGHDVTDVRSRRIQIGDARGPVGASRELSALNDGLDMRHRERPTGIRPNVRGRHAEEGDHG